MYDLNVQHVVLARVPREATSSIRLSDVVQSMLGRQATPRCKWPAPPTFGVAVHVPATNAMLCCFEICDWRCIARLQALSPCLYSIARGPSVELINAKTRTSHLTRSVVRASTCQDLGVPSGGHHTEAFVAYRAGRGPCGQTRCRRRGSCLRRAREEESLPLPPGPPLSS